MPPLPACSLSSSSPLTALPASIHNLFLHLPPPRPSTLRVFVADAEQRARMSRNGGILARRARAVSSLTLPNMPLLCCDVFFRYTHRHTHTRLTFPRLLPRRTYTAADTTPAVTGSHVRDRVPGPAGPGLVTRPHSSLGGGFYHTWRCRQRISPLQRMLLGVP